MSIFRTVRKIKDCDTCNGSGRVLTDPAKGTEGPCDTCGGEGRVEVLVRANRAAVHQAEVATKQMNPGPARKAAKARLAGVEKDGTVSSDDSRGFVNEDE
jgi:hypothetical protein